jgi:hypothetical protein
VEWLYPTVDLRTFHEFLYKEIDFIRCHVGHHHDMGNIIFTCQLPSLDEGVIDRPL